VAILIENLHLTQKNKDLDREDPNLFSYLKWQLLYFINKLGKKCNLCRTKERILSENKKEPILFRFNRLFNRLKKVFLQNKTFIILKISSFFIKNKAHCVQKSRRGGLSLGVEKIKIKKKYEENDVKIIY